MTLGASQDKVLCLPNSAEAFYRQGNLEADAVEHNLMPDGFRVVFADNIVAALEGEGAKVIGESGADVAVKAGDATALAQAVLRLYRAPAPEREAMGQRGRDHFRQHFERSVLLARLEEWIRSATESRGNTRKEFKIDNGRVGKLP